MTGLGGFNKSSDGVVIGLVQLQLPVVATKADLARQTAGISALVTKARNGLPNEIVTAEVRPAPVAGQYRLPWEAEVRETDGTSCGFPAPTRSYEG